MITWYGNIGQLNMINTLLLQADIIGAFWAVFLTMLTPWNIALLIGATLLGMIMGVIPGLGGTVTIALLIPVTFVMDPVPAFMMLAAVLGAVNQAGSLTSILINTPGRGGNAATLIDGYPLSRAGRAGEAIGASVTASAAGAIFGLILIVLTIPILQSLVLLFGPAEVFWVALWGITTIAVIVRGSVIAGLISAIFGILFGLHGQQLITGSVRWDYGFIFLADGFPLVTVIIGLFAVAEMIRLVAEGETIAGDVEIEIVKGGQWVGVKQVWVHRRLWFRSSIVGAIIGIVPGVGSTAANFIAYFQAVQTADDPGSFGTGDIRGVIAPESANDAKSGTALIPTLGLGIPGSASMAILLGAFVMHGITPGPHIFIDHFDVAAVIILALLFSNLISSSIGIIAANQLVKITKLDPRTLAVGVLMISFLGSYAINHNIQQTFLPVIFGLLGYGMIKTDMSRIPMIIGFVLADPIEDNFFRSLQVSRGGYGIFVESTLSVLLILLLFVSLFLPWIRAVLQRHQYFIGGR